ncbi:MAG: hypothetical protein WCN88_04890 [Candidatus Falkowbacteria bacterium]
MTKQKLQEQIIELKDGELKDLNIMTLITNRLNVLETQSNYTVENLKLLMEYLGVHLEDKGKVVVEDDECDLCYLCDCDDEELNVEDMIDYLKMEGYKVSKK